MKKNAVLLGLVAALYFTVYGFGLFFPPQPYYDEIYRTIFAEGSSARLGPYHSIHPPLGDFFILIFVKIFGNHSWAWRIAPLCAGFGCLVLVYCLAWKFFKNTRLAFFSGFLFLLDQISMTQARIAMLDSMMLFWMLVSLVCLVDAPIADKRFQKAQIFSGVFLGMALATRWVALTMFPVAAILYAKREIDNGNKKNLWKNVPLYFFVLPVLVYLGVFLADALIRGYDFSWIWKFQTHMAEHNLFLKKEHAYGSDWWTWPMMLRPIWYFFERMPDNADFVRGILCIGNPAIFWLIPILLGYSLDRAFKERSWILGLLIFGFFCQWLPWSLVGRVKFFHYFYPAMPFLVILLGAATEKIWSFGKTGRFLAAAYLFLVFVLFIYWYPLLIGFPVTDSYYRSHLWLRSWV